MKQQTTLSQSSRGNKVKVSFDKDDKFLYSIDTGSTKKSFFVEYKNIRLENFTTDTHTEICEKNEWYRNVGWLRILLSIGFMIYYQDPRPSFWLYVGLLCLGYYYISQVTFVSFDLGVSSLIFITGKKYEIIRYAIWEKRIAYVQKKITNAIENKDLDALMSMLYTITAYHDADVLDDVLFLSYKETIKAIIDEKDSPKNYRESTYYGSKLEELGIYTKEELASSDNDQEKMTDNNQDG